MSPPCNKALDAYADAALALIFPALPVEAAARAKVQFVRIAQLAAPVLAYPVDTSDEPAPVYRP
ncbi:DUF4089 domain-containing protein [Paraburkholderia sp. MMS20-SJTN17]|uniref:DUF4089 domain-containing protein n=1 Tax=Paraburkholderia translucens TaxID=2886945 RepID=A0ABS8KMV7_9BURK|nr:AtzG-like protein [Paraburkholderia sp. MMS20-SJTN17]MCC8405818.1 DUF4089 domain-containing protein [Paraburkholderia sp. MMS20-SJTN17]